MKYLEQNDNRTCYIIWKLIRESDIVSPHWCYKSILATTLLFEDSILIIAQTSVGQSVPENSRILQNSFYNSPSPAIDVCTSYERRARGIRKLLKVTCHKSEEKWFLKSKLKEVGFIRSIGDSDLLQSRLLWMRQ